VRNRKVLGQNVERADALISFKTRLKIYSLIDIRIEWVKRENIKENEQKTQQATVRVIKLE